MKYLPGTNTLCLEYNDLVFPSGIMPEGTYKSACSRGSIQKLNRGCYDTPVLVEWESMKPKYKALYIEKFGDPYVLMLDKPILNLVKTDYAARKYFADYRLPDERALPLMYQDRYSRQADWLNAIVKLLEDKAAIKDTLHISIKEFWDKIIKLHQLDKPVNPELPKSYERLLSKVNKYKSEGYASLIVDIARFNNERARIVTGDIESLLLSLYTERHGRATLVDVYRDYNAFMRGEKQPVDLDSGEMFQPTDFLVNGEAYEISLATVKYYLNKKGNREKVDMIKLSGHDWQQKHQPHNRRKGPAFAFSKISMDDYLPPFKTADGKREVWMYVIFDVASKAIVGVSFGIKKNHHLVDEALRDMLRMIVRNGWGIPMELELERSLNWERKGSDEQPDIFTQGNVFPFMRFAKANNSQEKMAERLLGTYKYEDLADEEGFLGRPFGRNENYKLNRDKQEARYMVKTLINVLKKHVQNYNNEPHHKEKNISRLEYLYKYQNPDAIKNHPSLIMPYIGRRTKTSIFRGDIQVQNEYYALDTQAVQAAGGVADVIAYWIPGENGEAPNEIYVYQNGKYIGEGKLIEQYQSAQAERTDRDWELMGKQSHRQNAYKERIEEAVKDIKRTGTIEVNDTDGIVHVRVSYDKAAWEAEDYAEAAPGKQQENSTKEGGFMQENDFLNDMEALKRRARSAL